MYSANRFNFWICRVPAAETELGLTRSRKVMRDRQQNKDGQKGH
jgi:hypothetical protein